MQVIAEVIYGEGKRFLILIEPEDLGKTFIVKPQISSAHAYCGFMIGISFVALKKEKELEAEA